MLSANADWIAKLDVSIPQAVWIACNNQIFISNATVVSFQYRKRYGLHAMSMPPFKAGRLI